MIVFCIFVYGLTITRFSTSLMAVFTTIEQSMTAFWRWLGLLLFMLTMLAVANMSVFHVHTQHHATFLKSFSSLFYVDRIPV